MQRVIFRKAGWAIDFEGCDGIVADLPKIFRGWSLHVTATSPATEHLLRARLRATKTGWTWRALGKPRPRDWVEIPPRHPLRVITDVHDAAIHWWLADHPDRLCLHGGAARLGKTLLCFPAQGFSGKSTLVTALADRGAKIFADDVLILKGPSCQAEAFGFPPRLRLPLTPDIRAFAQNNAGPEGAGWLYLNPVPELCAGFGEKAEPGALIQLCRDSSARRPRLEPLNTAGMLRLFIMENIPRYLPMLEVFRRFHRLASQKPRFQLRYDKPSEAADLLFQKYS